jgi:hypothetical protein
VPFLPFLLFSLPSPYKENPYQMYRWKHDNGWLAIYTPKQRTAIPPAEDKRFFGEMEQG